MGRKKSKRGERQQEGRQERTDKDEMQRKRAERKYKTQIIWRIERQK